MRSYSALMRVPSFWFCALSLFLTGSALAQERPVVRMGGTLGYQRTDRNAWVFGPSLEVTLTSKVTLRGEGQLEFGDLDDPFGASNIFSGPGPHVNHILVGPVYRPATYKGVDLAAGAGAGVSITHSRFAEKDFTFDPGAGLFAQAGKNLQHVEVALQLRLDFSPSVESADPDGGDVSTVAFRTLLSFNLPVYAPQPPANASR